MSKKNAAEKQRIVGAFNVSHKPVRTARDYRVPKVKRKGSDS